MLDLVELAAPSASASASTDDVVARACAHARANNSVALCEQCEWHPLPELAIGGALPTLAPSWRPTLPWFMCITQPEDETALTYFDMVRAAVVSARLHAPSLAPYVIYLHRPNQPFRHDAFSCWLAAAGVRVVRHRLTFYDEMPPARRKRRGDIGTAHLNIGAYGRLDVPGLVSGPLAAELRQRGLDASRVLYTDTDVIFTADFTLAAEMRKAGSPLRSFAAGTEVFSPSMNSGVMLLNVSAFVAERRAAPLDRCAALRCAALRCAALLLPRASSPPAGPRCCATPSHAPSASWRPTSRGSQSASRSFRTRAPLLSTLCRTSQCRYRYFDPRPRKKRAAPTAATGWDSLARHLTRTSSSCSCYSCCCGCCWCCEHASRLAGRRPVQRAGLRAPGEAAARRRGGGATRVALARVRHAHNLTCAPPPPWHGGATRAELCAALRRIGAFRVPSSRREFRYRYKPSDVRCWLAAMESGAWPARGWREAPRCRRGSCRWKPIMGSGCRYFGPPRNSNSVRRCSLHLRCAALSSTRTMLFCARRRPHQHVALLPAHLRAPAGGARAAAARRRRRRRAEPLGRRDVLVAHTARRHFGLRRSYSNVTSVVQ